MGDISTWNPVDNSNTTAPPDGWPEGMAPSAVNNSARAMMGAVRRWYDTVTAQIAGMLPLTGGTISGDLAVNGTNGLFLGATQLQNIANGLLVHNAAGGSATTRGPDAGFVFGDQNQTGVDWSWVAINGTAYLGNGAVRMSVSASGDLNMTGAFAATGAVTGPYVHSTGNVQADVAVGAPTIIATGTVQGAQLTSTGNINAAGTVTGTSFIGNVSVPASGPVTTGGTVTGGQLTSTGNINAAGSINASGANAGFYMSSRDGSTPPQWGLYAQAAAPSNAYLHFWNNVDGDYMAMAVGGIASPSNNVARCGFTGQAWFEVVSYIYTTASDIKDKADIKDLPDCLDLVAKLSPKRYRLTNGPPEDRDITHWGFVAQEVGAVMRESGHAFGGHRADPLGETISYPELTAVLWRACQEIVAQNAALAARITALEGNHV